MFIYFKNKKEKFHYRLTTRLIVSTLSLSLVFGPSAAQAQSILNLPIPGAMIAPSAAFTPVLLKGMTIHPNDPLKFDFIIDSGNTDFTPNEIKKESEKLVKYFLASMTVPKDDLWVNLSPFEENRIIPEELGKTELGRDMLAQDYILKQLTASLMYPEKDLGKKFWDKIYKQAREQFGTSEIPVNTFNKVWILPERATVYEYEQTVYITDSRFKVMLDTDYVAMESQQDDTATSRAPARDEAMDFQQKSTATLRAPARSQALRNEMSNAESRAPARDNSHEQSEQIIREIIIPAIEREVNEGEHFAPLRQIYHSLILAKWYKETVKNSLLSQVYVDQNKIAGVDVEDKTIKDQIYAQYMEAYKKGVFNYIKEDYDQLTQEMIPRKYFSGGINRFMDFSMIRITTVNDPREVEQSGVGDNYALDVRVNPVRKKAASPVEDGRAASPIRSMEDLAALLQIQLYGGQNEAAGETFSTILGRHKTDGSRLRKRNITRYHEVVNIVRASAVYWFEKTLERLESDIQNNKPEDAENTIDEMRMRYQTLGIAGLDEVDFIMSDAEFTYGVYIGSQQDRPQEVGDSTAIRSPVEVDVYDQDFREEFFVGVGNRTHEFAMIKPDAMELGLKEDVIDEIEERGFKVQVGPEIRISDEMAHDFYQVHEGKPFFEALIAFTTSGPMVLLFLQADDAVEKMDELKWKIREALGASDRTTPRNLFHASDSIDNAAIEARMIFSYLDDLKAAEGSSPIGQISDLNSVRPESAIAVVDWNIGRDEDTGEVTDRLIHLLVKQE